MMTTIITCDYTILNQCRMHESYVIDTPVSCCENEDVLILFKVTLAAFNEGINYVSVLINQHCITALTKSSYHNRQ